MIWVQYPFLNKRQKSTAVDDVVFVTLSWWWQKLTHKHKTLKFLTQLFHNTTQPHHIWRSQSSLDFNYVLSRKYDRFHSKSQVDFGIFVFTPAPNDIFHKYEMFNDFFVQFWVILFYILSSHTPQVTRLRSVSWVLVLSAITAGIVLLFSRKQRRCVLYLVRFLFLDSCLLLLLLLTGSFFVGKCEFVACVTFSVTSIAIFNMVLSLGVRFFIIILSVKLLL